jgi:hypothetical protein
MCFFFLVVGTFCVLSFLFLMLFFFVPCSPSNTTIFVIHKNKEKNPEYVNAINLALECNVMSSTVTLVVMPVRLKYKVNVISRIQHQSKRNKKDLSQFFFIDTETIVMYKRSKKIIKTIRRTNAGTSSNYIKTL